MSDIKRRLAVIVAVTVVAVLLAVVFNTNFNSTVYAFITISGIGGLFLWLTRNMSNK